MSLSIVIVIWYGQREAAVACLTGSLAPLHIEEVGDRVGLFYEWGVNYDPIRIALAACHITSQVFNNTNWDIGAKDTKQEAQDRETMRKDFEWSVYKRIDEDEEL